MVFLKCFPWYSLIICFAAGALSMLAFWLTLARIALRERYRQRGAWKAGLDISNGGDGDGKIASHDE